MLEEETFYAGRPTFSNMACDLRDRIPLVSVKAFRNREERGTAIVIDVKSLGRERFNGNFVRQVKIPGNNVWLCETIRSSSDILDAFMGNIQKLLIPCQFIKSWSLLDDAISLSEDCIPAVVCLRSKAVMLGGLFDPEKILGKLLDSGFHQALVIDADGSIPLDRWKELYNEFPSIIPYNHRASIAEVGAEDYAADAFEPTTDKEITAEYFFPNGRI